MAVKLPKGEYPSGHGRNDFKGFGPVVTKDTDWGDACLFDGGCFKQGDVDSNKYYHIAVVQSTINSKWFAYFEFGRTKPDGRPNSPAFQFTDCASKEDAQAACQKQFKAKNTSRGKWEKLGSKERFVPKNEKKDLYVVRPTATRMVGLPCCENIANDDAKGAAKAPAKTTKKTTKKKTARRCDPQTHKLFSDLIGGAVTYTNAVMTGGKGKATLPMQAALDEGREVLDDAMVRIGKVGSDLDDQVNDKQLRKLTYHLYGIIPKAKPQKVGEEDWILSKDNIAVWKLDIDAFETALQATDMDIEEDDSGSDVMAGIPADVVYVPPNDGVYEYLVGKWDARAGGSGWWPRATRYQSTTGRCKLRIHNLWRVERHGDNAIMRAAQKKTVKEMPSRWNNERPMFHDKKRPDLDVAERRLFWESNTGLLFHGTRSVNVPGIVRENLRFPKELSGVQITGAMFGPGSYFADDWSKSAGYCSHRNSYYGGGGQVKGRKSFMFAFDVILGNPCVAPGPRGYAGPPKGNHCVFGKAGHSHVHNNEWIIYHKGRIEMRYLAEIEW
jgi:hypothetical protein